MERTSQGRRYSTQNGYVRERAAYNYSNTAADLNRMLDEEPQGTLRQDSQKRQEKSVRMDLKYVILCMVGLCVILGIVIGFVKIRSELTESIERVSHLENTYINLKNDNNEEEERILNSVDMDEVKRIAIEELGMHYAKDGQIIIYADEMNDYVRQYSDMD